MDVATPKSRSRRGFQQFGVATLALFLRDLAASQVSFRSSAGARAAMSAQVAIMKRMTCKSCKQVKDSKEFYDFIVQCKDCKCSWTMINRRCKSLGLKQALAEFKLRPGGSIQLLRAYESRGYVDEKRRDAFDFITFFLNAGIAVPGHAFQAAAPQIAAAAAPAAAADPAILGALDVALDDAAAASGEQAV